MGSHEKLLERFLRFPKDFTWDELIRLMNRYGYSQNFVAAVKYSDEDEAFIGRIEGIDSVVSFEGQSINELKSAFMEAVESYLDFCYRKGKKPYTGAFNLRKRDLETVF